MSETPAVSRAFGGADDFERRMRMIGQPATPDDGPLAELARLVGHEDPFRNRLPSGRPLAEIREVPKSTPGAEPGEADMSSDDARLRPTLEPRSTGPVIRRVIAADKDFAAFDHGPEGHGSDARGAPEEPPVAHRPVGAAAYPFRAAPAFSEGSIDQPRAIEPIPDSWAAQAEAEDHYQDERSTLVATRDEVHRDQAGGGSRRTLIVLAAVVVLTGGGLAASFLARPTGGLAASGAAAPTILAATGPSKVQPETTPTDADAPSQNSTLLDKNSGDGTATAKVVDSVEQPVDLAQAVKPAPVTQADPAPQADTVSTSGFPEPRKVKTVTVRPDGTIIATSPAPIVTVDPTAGQPASLAFDPRMSLPTVSPDQPPAAPATPIEPPRSASGKSTVRAGTTPKPAAPSASDETGSSPAQAATVRPKVKPAVHPKPTQEAVLAPAAPDAAAPATATPDAAAPAPDDAAPDAAAAAPAPLASGTYAVQLGAPGTEAEAQSAAARLQKKFAGLLGAYTPAIRKADVGSRSVYRIRVGSMSQADAKLLCVKLKASGGGCFVVAN